MSHLRQDSLTGRWVIMASGRRDRPNEFPLQHEGGSSPATCPFCPGQEDRTTREILALGRGEGAAENTPGWRLRVFPNLYPALSAEGAGEPPVQATGGPVSGPGPESMAEELFVQSPGVGAHEVIAYSPDHQAGLATLSQDDLADLLQVLQDRYAALAEDPRYRYILQFVNHGPEAGATLAHPHLQILATTVVPAMVLQKQERMERHRSRTGRCLVCDLLAAEEKSEARLIDGNEYWMALAPWASRFPWEMLLAPRRHQGSILEAGPEQLRALAGLLGDVLRRLDTIHENAPLNLIIHGAPLDESAPDCFHWHLEVCPRLARLAGFETGTGFAINSILPEEAARRLRTKEC